MENLLINVLHNRKTNREMGVYSACTANEVVIRTVLKKALASNTVAVIEATANQVDQNGGYTGMTPENFKDMVYRLADEVGIEHDRIILGGDHLGPLTVSHLDESEAMAYAKELVKAYTLAGFTKLHIDTSMKVSSDDQNERLSDETIARRACELIQVTEEAWSTLPEPKCKIAYIIGSEVPIPGGAQEITEMQVTSVEDFYKTAETFQELMKEYELNIFDQVVAIVVQPGVEERDAESVRYNRENAAELTASLSKYDPMVFEGHSSDYQSKKHLRQMVEDGIAILKVGPALTFAYREALFALSAIENQLIEQKEDRGNFIEVLRNEMVSDPSRWNKYYFGTEQELEIKRLYSFSDSARYYLPRENVSNAIEKLMSNLKGELPLNLISQFAPIQYRKIVENEIENSAQSIIEDWIGVTIDDYLHATIR